MATTKTVNVTTGKFLNYQVTKTGYKPVTGTIYVDSDKTINVNMVSTSSSSEIYSLGDRILGIASFVCYYKPGGNYDNKPISTAVISQTTGIGLNNLGVKKGIFENQVNPSSTLTGANTFTFTYDGTNWSLNGSTVLLNTYGIFYNTNTSTLSSGDIIQVVYTVYNKYACFVLDANYRIYDNRICTDDRNFPDCPTYSNVSSSTTESSSNIWYYNKDGQESATWCNQYLLDNCGYTWNELPSYNYCRTLGTFILANGIQLNALLPNLTELQQIWVNRVFLDSIDPIIQSGTTTCNLTNWNFNENIAWSCINKNHSTWTIDSNDGFRERSNRDSRQGIIPVFEVPCM